MREHLDSLQRRLAKKLKTSAEDEGVFRSPSINADADDAGNENLTYVHLSDFSQEVKPRIRGALDILRTLGISAEALGQGDADQLLQRLLTKEMSCFRYFRWAVLDSFVEKILQGFILNKQDISPEEVNFCAGMIRQMPEGRSLLLSHAWGLKKMYALRALVLTTEMVLTKTVKISIAAFLSYRLYALFQMQDTSDFSELTALFEDNSKKGITSLVYFLSKFDQKWLYLLLSSPVIIGALKGLWDIRKSEILTENAIIQLQEAVEHHTNELLKKSYLWGDVLRQMLPIPGFSSVSERVQKAEQQLRWDGRISHEERALLFSNIERLALHGSGMSKLNAMQSLAKIVHSLSIKDFPRLQYLGYPKETLVQILRIKTQAFRDLKTLSTRARLDLMSERETSSMLSRVYAAYLLWWLGMGQFKYSPLLLSFKLAKLALEGLFLKSVVESILEAIKCPDKQGFNIGTGEYPVWANQLTVDCFREFVRQFRFLSKEESFEPFLAQLNNFDFTEVEFIDLSSKALTSNETRDILNVLNKRVSIKMLNLEGNRINKTMELSFPNGLQSLKLMRNNIGAEGAKGLQLPLSLQSLGLGYNNIGAEGAKEIRLPSSLTSLDLMYNNIGDQGSNGLQLPPSLKTLDLQVNSIGDEGAKGLRLPPSLQSLDLNRNSIGAEGAKGLKLPSSLQSLDLSYNRIGAEGAKGLQLPPSLRSLNLMHSNIGDEGAKGLQLPTSLQLLNLYLNNIGSEGAKGLQLPPSLQSLDLRINGIGAEGAKGLRLPSLLTSLNLSNNGIGAEGAKGLRFPSSLQFLVLSANSIGDEGAKGLQLPSSLTSLVLSANSIGDEGAKGLQLPSLLTSLVLHSNNIGDEGAKGLKLPSSLQSLDLQSNSISDEGAKGLELPSSLQSLYLIRNKISAEGAKGLRFPSSLQSLVLSMNSIGDEGAKGLRLLSSLQFLNLNWNSIGDEGAKGLKLPSSLQSLDLSYNRIGAAGAKGLELPSSLQSLDVSFNNIGNEGVNALLKKIPKTNLTNIRLDTNLYNSTDLNVNLTIQQQILLKNCQDKLCYANTSLSQDAYQTSGATRMQPPLFFSWLKKPFDKLAEYTSDCLSETLSNLGARLEKIVSQSPSYFPNIHSPEINDWEPSGSLMLHQFKTGSSNTLLLSATQISIQTRVMG